LARTGQSLTLPTMVFQANRVSKRDVVPGARMVIGLFEGFVTEEILKSQGNQGGRTELYSFRDRQGLGVDFFLPKPNAGLWLIECKAGKTARPAMAAPLLALRRTMEKRSTRLIVVYGNSRWAQAIRAVASRVEAIELERFVESLTAINQNAHFLRTGEQKFLAS
jgi:Domain of unknown function (DUF4143)